MEPDHKDDSHSNTTHDTSSKGNDKVPLLDDNTNLTLTKKKSWFGSIKAALRAKTTVGPLRAADHGANHTENETHPPKHKRNSSVANSVVGSLKSLRGGKGRMPDTPTRRKSLPEEDSPREVPLPSSPINVSAAAPILDLDMGPAGFGSAAFIQNALTDPANITTGTPITSRKLHIPADIEVKFAQHELDRASSHKIDDSRKSKIFERSVTPPNASEQRTLRNMRSLNAMTETYAATETVSNIKSDNDAVTGSPNDSESPTLFTTPESKSRTPRRDIWSASTTTSAPADMPELTRQDHQSPPDTPSRGKSSTLPLRRKRNGEGGASSVQPKAYDTESLIEISITVQNKPIESAVVSPAQSQGDDDTRVGEWPGKEMRADTIFTTETKIWADAASNTRSAMRAQKDLAPVAASSGDSGSEDSIEESRTTQSRPVPSMPEGYLSPKTMLTYYVRDSEGSDDASRSSKAIATDDDPEASVHLLASPDVVQFENEDSELSVMEGLSPHRGPLVPELYRRIPVPMSLRPGNTHSPATYTAGLGDAHHRFSPENWLTNTPSPSASRNRPDTASRRAMDGSVDSSTMDEYAPPANVRSFIDGSDDLAASYNTPPSGSGFHFNFDRPVQDPPENAPDQVASMNHDHPDEIDANALAYVDIDAAYASSPAGNPVHSSTSNTQDTQEKSSESTPTSSEERGNTAQEEPSVLSPSNSEDTTSAVQEGLADVKQTLADCITVLQNRGSFSLSESKESTECLGRLDSLREKKRSSSIRPFTSNLHAKTNPNGSNDLAEPLDTRSSIEALNTRSNSETEHQHITPGLFRDSSRGPAQTTDRTRVPSADTLDESLRLYNASSPDSGYRAGSDTSSPPSKWTGSHTERCRCPRR